MFFPFACLLAGFVLALIFVLAETLKLSNTKRNNIDIDLELKRRRLCKKIEEKTKFWSVSEIEQLLESM